MKGIHLTKEQRDKIDQEIKYWYDLFVGRMLIQRKYVPVRPDPLGSQKMSKDLRVLQIEVYPSESFDNFFAIKIIPKKGEPRSKCYEFDRKRNLIPIIE